MPMIGKSLGTVIGPRGKMPKPLPPNIEIAPIIDRLRKSIRIRSRDRTTFHCQVGKEGMSATDIAENIEAVLKRIESKMERGEANIASVYVKATMGEAIRIK
jgi:large subunit ribosomal protein L1